jgi:hypothetical protein
MKYFQFYVVMTHVITGSFLIVIFIVIVTVIVIDILILMEI